jgi:hypothetical protein
MEPVFMVLGQSAATAAVMAIDKGVDAQSVDYGELHKRLLADGQILEAPAEIRRGRLDAGKLEGIVVDDEQAVKSEGWTHSAVNQPYLGLGYLHDGNARDGKASITFRVDVPSPGAYRYRVLYPTNANRASNALVSAACEGGVVEARINQKQESVWLGPCRVSKPLSITVSNKGADGYVVVDGLQIAPAR